MRNIYLFSLAALMFAAACAGKPNHFVLRGEIPGATDSTEVELASDYLPAGLLASGYVVDGKFELKGQVPFPALCRLSMNDQKVCDRDGKSDEAKYVEANFFVENGNLTFHTTHIDILPGCFWNYDAKKELNYTVNGSPAQDVYALYRQECVALEALVRESRRNYMENENMEEFRAGQRAKEELERKTMDFIRGHNNLEVNLFLAEKLLKDPFTYGHDYLDSLTALFKDCRDTSATLRKFRASVLNAEAFVQGKPLEEAQLLNPAGDMVALLAALGKERYTLIDFWASWCGPCRASFPHLRNMHKLYGDKIQFVSISVDKKNGDWQKAMKEEKLPWTQLLSTPIFSKAMGKLYGIQSVPTFLIVDPEGNVVFSGHESGELEMKVEEIVQNVEMKK